MALQTRPQPADAADRRARSSTREERKYPVAEARAALIAAWISARVPPDRDYPRGTITSCYYDTASLDAYWEAADGFWGKTKLRLRWYGDPADAETGADGAWLELKHREGGVGSKQRLHLSIEDGPVLAAGIRLPRREQLTEALRELGAPAAPTVEAVALVRYERRRWADLGSGLRVSLDTRVRAAAPRPGLVWRPVPDGAVLELKSAGPLPARLDGLARLGLRRAAHSKYAAAVELTSSRVWRGGA